MRVSVFLLFACLLVVEIHAQPQTVGLFSHTAGSLDNGYVLFSPIQNTTTYLIDKCGKFVHSWPSANVPFLSPYLLADGSLLRPGTDAPSNVNSEQGGILERIDWNGNLLWRYTVGDSNHYQHHDIQPLPNGNILVLARDNHSVAEAHAAGRDTLFHARLLIADEILELKPVGTDSAVIVWRWRVWDHLVQDFNAALPNYGVVANHPERINFNFPQGTQEEDWLHPNSVKYNAALDQIMFSCYNFNEVWVIDHSTTTAQAATHSGGRSGKGGDLLYRWGNPQAYKHGTAADQKFYGQHTAQWIPSGYPHAGDIMVFNNGNNRPDGSYSSIDIFAPPAVDANGNYGSTYPYPPTAQNWVYVDPPPTTFYSGGGSSGQMLANGNVLIGDAAHGRLFEVDSLKKIVWDYTNPVGPDGPVAQGSHKGGTPIFRCTFYPGSYAGFQGHTLIAGQPIELNPLPYECELNGDTSLRFVPATAGRTNPLSMHNDTVFVGQFRDDTLTVINRCVATPVSILSVVLADNDPGEYSLVKTIATPIPPNGRDFIVVRYRPTSCFGRIAQMSITSNAPVNPAHTVMLNGFGGCSELAFSTDDTLFKQTHLVIGTANHLKYDTFYVCNTGSLPVNIVSQSLSGINQSEYRVVVTLPPRLAPGECDSIVIVFLPTVGDTNAKQAQFVIHTDALTNGTLVKELRGFATTKATVQRTVGLVLHTDGSLDSGFVLFAPPNDSTYLIDKCGKEVHVWPSSQPGNGFVYLLPNGNILRGGEYQPSSMHAGGGTLQMQDWDGRVLWSYVINDSVNRQNRDAVPLPNGNILLLAREVFTPAQAYAAGRDTAGLGGQFIASQIYEIQPAGSDSAVVVWRWHAWDHLVQSRNAALANYGVIGDHPELANVNYAATAAPGSEWLHISSIRYNPALDVIMVSVRNFGEIWMLDHSTTTGQASAHSGGHFDKGGDIIYRWGNPAAYGRGSAAQQTFFSNHCADWIPAGTLHSGGVIVFNNGVNRAAQPYSSVDVFTPVLDSPGVHTSSGPYLPNTFEYRYVATPETSFFSQALGSAQMLSNGNTLICNGRAGRFFEVDFAGGKVWDYIVPVNAHGALTQGVTPDGTGLYACQFYPYSFPAFRGKNLEGKQPIERSPLEYDCTLDVTSTVRDETHTVIDNRLAAFPNPASDHITLSDVDPDGHVAVHDYLGRAIPLEISNGVIHTASLAGGVYRVVVTRGGKTESKLVTVMK